MTAEEQEEPKLFLLTGNLHQDRLLIRIEATNADIRKISAQITEAQTKVDQLNRQIDDTTFALEFLRKKAHIVSLREYGAMRYVLPKMRVERANLLIIIEKLGKEIKDRERQVCEFRKEFEAALPKILEFSREAGQSPENT